MDELDALRQEIRKIDKNLVALFDRRLAVSGEIAAVKEKSHTPTYDSAREEKNIRELSALLANAADQPYFKKWYQLLMDISKERQISLRSKEK